jgi:hypothetical protein
MMGVSNWSSPRSAFERPKDGRLRLAMAALLSKPPCLRTLDVKQTVAYRHKVATTQQTEELAFSDVRAARLEAVARYGVAGTIRSDGLGETLTLAAALENAVVA